MRSTGLLRGLGRDGPMLGLSGLAVGLAKWAGFVEKVAGQSWRGRGNEEERGERKKEKRREREENGEEKGKEREKGEEEKMFWIFWVEI